MARWVPVQELFDELEEQATEREAVAAGSHEHLAKRHRELRATTAAQPARRTAAPRRNGAA